MSKPPFGYDGLEQAKRYALGMALGGLITGALEGGHVEVHLVEPPPPSSEADAACPCYLAEAARKVVDAWHRWLDGYCFRDELTCAIDELAKLLEKHP